LRGFFFLHRIFLLPPFFPSFFPIPIS
jgi:hypothetical protein